MRLIALAMAAFLTGCAATPSAPGDATEPVQAWCPTVALSPDLTDKQRFQIAFAIMSWDVDVNIVTGTEGDLFVYEPRDMDPRYGGICGSNDIKLLPGLSVNNGDLMRVAAHEFGHWLGLGHNDTTTDTVMRNGVFMTNPTFASDIDKVNLETIGKPTWRCK